ncbi:HAD hydrolase family protein, partial [Clostridium sp. ZBS2]
MKLLASDLDGTLVVGNNLRNDKDLTLINKLKERGHKLIVSTGRSYDMVIPLMEKYDIEYDYLLLCNG